MFEDCSSLEQAPELSATELADSCYACMFSDCTSLTQAPELPATKLAKHCYTCMFSSCTSLVSAPTLSATELAEDCYSCMFEDCTSLHIKQQDTKTGDEGFILTCPEESKIPTNAVANMFAGCICTGFDGTPTPNKSYY